MKERIMLRVLTPEKEIEMIPAYIGNTLASALEAAGWLPGSSTPHKGAWRVHFSEAETASEDEAKEKKVYRADLFWVQEPVQVELESHFIKNDWKNTTAWNNFSVGTLPWQYKKIYLPGRQMIFPGDMQEPEHALYDRMTAVLRDYKILFDIVELKEMAALDREARPVIELQALTQETRKEVYSVTLRQHPIIGIVIALETEMVSVRLYDMQTGALLEAYDADSILYQRLMEAAERRKKHQEGSTNSFEELHQAIRSQIQEAVAALLQKQGTIRPRDIYRTVVIGQTALLHILLGMSLTHDRWGGLRSLFYEEMQLCPQGQVPEMNPWGEFLILRQWGHMLGSDALSACIALETKGTMPILILQPLRGGYAALRIGDKLWAMEGFSGILPSAELLQSCIQRLTGAAKIRLRDIRQVFVCVPIGEDFTLLREKMASILTGLEEKTCYAEAPWLVGGQMLLLSEAYRERMTFLQKNTVFLSI